LFFIKDEKTLLFRFEYGGFKANINLLNRSIEWIKEYISAVEDKKFIHPEHFQNDIDIPK